MSAYSPDNLPPRGENRLADRPTKLMLFGLDCATPELTQRFVEEGAVPNLSALMRRGVFAEKCLPPFPTLTPSNWTTVATGAWPSTHGITDFEVHHPGEPLDVTHTGFNSGECSAEYLWSAAERAGKTSVLVKYPASWPPTITRGFQVDGCIPNCAHHIAPDQMFISGEQLLAASEPLGSELACVLVPPDKPQRVHVLKLVPHDSGRLRAETAVLPYRGAAAEFVIVVDPQRLRLQVHAGGRSRAQLADLGQGEWSDFTPVSFGPDPQSQGWTRFKLLSLHEGGRARLYSTAVMPRRSWTFPADLAPELCDAVGPFIQGPPVEAVERGWIDPMTFIEACRFKIDWLARASNYLLSKQPWDLYFVQSHSIDHAQHCYIVQADPLTARSQEESQQYLSYLRELYSAVDEMIGKVVESSGDANALVIVLSDHGGKSWEREAVLHQNFDRRALVRKILCEAGLLHYLAETGGKTAVDWSHTKAIPQREIHVYLNVRGRDPDGIVEPGEEYERVRNEVIATLKDYRDPETGRSPFALVLKQEDALILGIRGPRCGDVIYAMEGSYAYLHGQHLPTTQFGISSLRSLFVMAGPGVKHGVRLDRTIWLQDVVPTACYLMDLPVPRDCEGAVVYQALEDP